MKLSGGLLAGALLLVSTVGVGVSREALAKRYASVKASADTYALPEPEQLKVLTLGYRSAIADLIYAHLLVDYGLHFQDHRRFEFAGEYLDTITELDPAFEQVYFYVDALLTLQPVPASEKDYDKAREIMLRGTRRFPYSQELWLTTGEYLAYLAPSNLKDKAKAEQWRLEGARTMARACELASDNPNIPYQCINAAGLLNQSGQREALIQMLTRTLAVNDDPEIRAQALRALKNWVGERQREKFESRDSKFQNLWARDLPQVSKERMLLLGQRVDPERCAGLETGSKQSCASSWRRWSEIQR